MQVFLWKNGFAVADKKIRQSSALVAVKLDLSLIYPNPTITFGLVPAEIKTQVLFALSADKKELHNLLAMINSQ